MEKDRAKTVSVTLENRTLSPDELLQRAKSAATRRRRRVEYEANTTVRKCLSCDAEFRSEGVHHRLCSRCKNRR